MQTFTTQDKKSNKFYKLYDSILCDRSLSANELKLFTVINGYTEMNGIAHLSYSIIEKFMCRKYIKTTIDKLVEKGRIERIGKSHYKSLPMGTSGQESTGSQTGTEGDGQMTPKDGGQKGNNPVPKGKHRKKESKKESSKEEKLNPSGDSNTSNSVPSEQTAKEKGQKQWNEVNDENMQNLLKGMM